MTQAKRPIIRYRGDLYDRLYAGWQRIDRAAHADGARPRVESLWLSPNVRTNSLFQQETPHG